MTRTVSVAGICASLLLAFWLLRIAGGPGPEAARLLAATGAAASARAAAPAPAAPETDPLRRAIDDLAAWPSAASPTR